MLYNTFWGMTLGFVVTGLVIVSIATGTTPWKVLLQTWQRLNTNRNIAITLCLMTMVLLINKVELGIETKILSDVVTWDFTPVVQQLEGSLSVYLQEVSNQLLTSLLTFMYVFVFPALIWGSFLVYTHHEEDHMVKKLFYCFILNYLIAIPFYLFVPVNEAWYHNGQVKLLIEQVYPAYNTQYRLLSGLNNCFPSLHTSISLTLALLARESKCRRWWLISMKSAALIVFSTLYLGIHWFGDVVAGGLMAFLIIRLAGWLVENDYKWTFVLPNLAWFRMLAAKRYVAAYLRKSSFLSSLF